MIPERMSKMKKVIITKKSLALVLSAILIALSLAACGSSASASTGLKAALGYASEKVSDFSHYQRRNAAFFANDIFSRATAAAMMIRDDTAEEDLETIAHCLSLDSITVADETRTVVASYPAGEAEKSLKELEDKTIFSQIVRNIADKEMTDPVSGADGGTYSLLAGVKRSDGTGVVIIGVTTEDYADVCGDTIAEKCGVNTIVLRDDTVISSTLVGVNAQDTAQTLGISDEDMQKESFTLTVGDARYLCLSASAGDYTVICAEPA